MRKRLRGVGDERELVRASKFGRRLYYGVQGYEL